MKADGVGPSAIAKALKIGRASVYRALASKRQDYGRVLPRVFGSIGGWIRQGGGPVIDEILKARQLARRGRGPLE